MLLMVGVQVEALDFGSSGVWDSPLATDYWVKRFGFMWAGGRSGMHGLKALQSISSEATTPKFESNVYNPSGMYGMKVMDPSAPEYKYPGHTNNNNFIAVDRAYNTQPEKSMVKLSPMVVPMPGESKQMKFDRFMAVP